MEEGDETRDRQGEHWYYYLPLALVGLSWLLFLSGQIAIAIDSQAYRYLYGESDGTRLLRQIHALFSVAAWVSLLICTSQLASRKRVPGWWVLGAFCPCLNLAVYLALLLMRPRRGPPRPPETEPYGSLVFGHEQGLPRPAASYLDGSFVCEACEAVLNYGVSECTECGQRYRYHHGVPEAE